MKKTIFALCGIIMILTGCRTTKTITTVTTDTLRIVTHDTIMQERATNTDNSIQYESNTVRTITLSAAGDTVRDVERTTIRENNKQIKTDSLRYMTSKSDSLQHTGTNYIRYTVKEELSVWQTFKLKYFVILLLVTIGLIITLAMMICKPLRNKITTCL